MEMGAILQEWNYKMFGNASFRDKQVEACMTVAAGGDVVILLPTGGGKSLCYHCQLVSQWV